ncbi:FMN-binding protein [candidate division KSB1 bacterium]|nr:FMN-binding protein [candidate division KSB1 bacterium]
MKKSLTTILFMVIITVIFISALASINELSKTRILQNQKLDEYKSILYAFGIFPKEYPEQLLSRTSTTADIKWRNPDQITEYIETYTRTLTLPVNAHQRQLLNTSFLSWQDSVEIVLCRNDAGDIVACGFPLKGKGLWGTLEAFVAIKADLSAMVGIDFTEQVETPGLGARITETEFKSYFRNLDLTGFYRKETQTAPIIMVQRKEQSNIERATNSLQAITGATQTCSGVLAMLNTDLAFYIDVLRQNSERLQRGKYAW